MQIRRKSLIGITMMLALILFLSVPKAYSKEFKVLVVMSYEQNYPWDLEIQEGINAILAGVCQIDYFYLNTKTNWADGPKRAKEAFKLYQRLQPDGVIVADDDGQAMLVVPYLKNKVKTPVIFCGVNAEPSAYGYPAANVTGVLEREPMKQSLLLLRQLVPQVKSFGLITKESPTAKAVENQLNAEKDSYPIAYIGAKKAQNLSDAIQVMKEFKTTCDALLYITMEGLPNNAGRPLTDAEVLPNLIKVFGKPVITNAMYRVKYGALSAVVKTGQEHGSMAGEMVLKAMRGTPVSQIPITQNRFGKRIINVDKMIEFDIKPKPMLIRSSTLVRTER